MGNIFKILILSFIFLTQNTNAFVSRIGSGFSRTENNFFLSLGKQDNLNRLFVSKLEAGFWLNQLGNQKSSIFGSYNLGIRYEHKSLYLESIHGIGLISHTDSLNGSKFEFFHDIGIGLVRNDKSSIGISLFHISNAGLYKPNIGRNFISLKINMN